MLIKNCISYKKKQNTRERQRKRVIEGPYNNWIIANAASLAANCTSICNYSVVFADKCNPQQNKIPQTHTKYGVIFWCTYPRRFSMIRSAYNVFLVFFFFHQNAVPRGCCMKCGRHFVSLLLVSSLSFCHWRRHTMSDNCMRAVSAGARQIICCQLVVHGSDISANTSNISYKDARSEFYAKIFCFSNDFVIWKTTHHNDHWSKF